MPRVSRVPNEESNDDAGEHLFETQKQVASMHAAFPTFVCGVNRKINTGNFENIDVYSGVSMSVMAMPDDLEAFKQAVAEAAELGFMLASRETAMRYWQIKELQGGGRATAEAASEGQPE